MIPEERFSSAVISGSLHNPWSRRSEVSQHRGPVALQDPSQGLDVQLWTASAGGTDITLSSPNTPAFTWYTHAQEIEQVSLSFDTNGRPCVAFVDDIGGSYLRWFDPVLNATTNLDLSAFNVTTPRVTLDDDRPFNGVNSDVILGYVRAGAVRYRQLRDRFTIEHTPTVGAGGLSPSVSSLAHISMNSRYRLEFLTDPYNTPSGGPTYVYEMERGFSFDGFYIPHFIELNWYFGDAPISYHGIQKVRLHGLTKGQVRLQVDMAGMQTEYDSDYMEPQWLDMPYREEFIQQSFIPTTTYVDYSNRGLSIQMKYSGRNQNLTAPEPSHVIQVLVIQSSPVQSGFRAN